MCALLDWLKFHTCSTFPCVSLPQKTISHRCLASSLWSHAFTRTSTRSQTSTAPCARDSTTYGSVSLSKTTPLSTVPVVGALYLMSQYGWSMFTSAWELLSSCPVSANTPSRFLFCPKYYEARAVETFWYSKIPMFQQRHQHKMR